MHGCLVAVRDTKNVAHFWTYLRTPALFYRSLPCATNRVNCAPASASTSTGAFPREHVS